MYNKDELAKEIEGILEQKAKSENQKRIHEKLRQLGEKFGDNAEEGIEPSPGEIKECNDLVEEWKRSL